MLGLVAMTPQSMARFGQQSLDSTVNNTTAIVSATVIGAEQVVWHSSKGRESCGYKTTIQVNELLKGTVPNVVSIASRYPLPLNAQYLMFLKPRNGNFTTDVNVIRVVAEQEMFEACLVQLPTVMDDWLSTSRFYGQDGKQLLLSYWLQVPDALKGVVIQLTSINVDGQPQSLTSSPLADAADMEELILPRTMVSWQDFKTALISIIHESNP